jgi:hypothetical protein
MNIRLKRAFLATTVSIGAMLSLASAGFAQEATFVLQLSEVGVLSHDIVKQDNTNFGAYMI